MGKKLIVGVLGAALLLSGGLVGVSFAGAGGITEPKVIELSLDLCSGPCRGFELRDPVFGQQGTALIVVSRDTLFDVDGTSVGNQSYQCTVSSGRNKGGTPWVCTYVITLKAGPYTERGTVVTTGIYRFSDPPEELAVTGGTGAYENVRGVATMELVGQGADRHEVLTLNLIP